MDNCGPITYIGQRQVERFYTCMHSYFLHSRMFICEARAHMGLVEAIVTMQNTV